MTKKLNAFWCGLFIIIAVTLSCGVFSPFGLSAAYAAPEGEGDFKELKLTIGHSHPTNADDDVHYLCVQFAKHVTEATGGKVTFDIIGDGILGAEPEQLEAVGFGTSDMTTVTSITISTQSASHLILSMPFLFQNYDEIHRFLDSEIMAEINEKILNDCNAKVLTIGDGGFRQSINNVHPITSAESYKNLKWRVMESPLHIAIFRALGSNPTPMNGLEILTGLQQGTIDGLDIPTTSIYSMQLYTAAKYLDLTNHMFTGWYLLINKARWDAFPDNLQKIFVESAAKATAEQRVLVVDSEVRKIDTMEAAGKITNRNVETSSMREAVKPLYDEYRGRIGGDILDRTMSFLGIN